MPQDVIRHFRYLQFATGDIFDRLPQELRHNLSQGDGIEFEPKRQQLCYRRELIWLVLEYILRNDDLLPIYTNQSFRENIRCYLQRFIIPFLNEQYRDVEFEFVTTNDTKDPREVPECVLMHGRFNGVPHPGYVRSLQYIKRNHDLPLTLAIETDDYSTMEGQFPFLDPVFRASMLWYTGLIDRLVIIKAPYHGAEDEETILDYWEIMYGVDTFVLNPEILIAHGDEDYWRKEDRSPMRLRIKTLDMLNVGGLKEFHMTELRTGNLTPDEVRDCWSLLDI